MWVDEAGLDDLDDVLVRDTHPQREGFHVTQDIKNTAYRSRRRESVETLQRNCPISQQRVLCAGEPKLFHQNVTPAVVAIVRRVQFLVVAERFHYCRQRGLEPIKVAAQVFEWSMERKR